jgi:pimeloyl-ACP methyl ester carboxylesterase
MPLPNQLLAKTSRRVPMITKQIRRLMRAMVAGDAEKATQKLMSSIPASDQDVLYAPENVEMMVMSIYEGFRKDSSGVAHDDILVNKDWGFDLGEITTRIDIWNGDADVNVPIHAGKYLHKNIPNSRAKFLPGEGYFFIILRWKEILSALVSDYQMWLCISQKSWG